MRRFALLLGGMAALLAAGAAAQPPNKVIRTFPEAVVVRLARGDILRVDADSAFAYNLPGAMLNRANDSLVSVWRLRIALTDSLMRAQDSIIRLMREIHQVQTQSWDSLRARFNTADSLVHVSVRNTDRALSYAKRLRVASYLASGLAGGAVGGFGIKSAGQDGFDWWPGFATGAAAALAINWLIQKVVR